MKLNINDFNENSMYERNRYFVLNNKDFNSLIEIGRAHV